MGAVTRNTYLHLGTDEQQWVDKKKEEEEKQLLKMHFFFTLIFSSPLDIFASMPLAQFKPLIKSRVKPFSTELSGRPNVMIQSCSIHVFPFPPIVLFLCQHCVLPKPEKNLKSGTCFWIIDDDHYLSK